MERMQVEGRYSGKEEVTTMSGKEESGKSVKIRIEEIIFEKRQN